jgi:transposase-like protein
MSGRRPIPIPADFAANSPKMALRDLAELYGVSRQTAFRWRKQAGLARTLEPSRAYADDFGEDRSLSIPKLASHYGVSEATVSKWRSSIAQPGATTPQTIPDPRRLRHAREGLDQCCARSALWPRREDDSPLAQGRRRPGPCPHQAH